METCFLAIYTSWCLTHVSESMMTCICGVRSHFELSSFQGDAAVPSSLCPLPYDSGRPVGVVLTHEQKSHEILMICYWLCGKHLENITFQINKIFTMHKSAPKSHHYPSGYRVGGLGAQTRGRCQPGRVIVPFLNVFTAEQVQSVSKKRSVLLIKQLKTWRSPIGHRFFHIQMLGKGMW